MSELKAYTYGPASGKAPKQLVILLHGLGADGRDLLGLAPEFADAVPDAVFVSPDAPFPCDMAPMGYQWFSLQEWSPESILKGVQDAAPAVMDFIDGLVKKFNIPYSRIALIGFSQGTMMSLYVAPRLKEKIAGVVAYSGALVWEDQVDARNLMKMPILLIHGVMDAIVPVAAYYHAKDRLEKSGFAVEGGISPLLMHNIDGKGIRDAREFLKTVLGQD